MSHTSTKYQFMVTGAGGEYSDRNVPAKNEKKKKNEVIKINKLPNSLKLHL